MSGKENKLRDKVKDALPEHVHASWIESHDTAAGFPDLELCTRGVSNQIELKHADAKGKLLIRKTQFLWFRKRVRAGGRPLLLVEHEDPKGTVFYVVRGEYLNVPEPMLHMDQLLARPHWSFLTVWGAVMHVLNYTENINADE